VIFFKVIIFAEGAAIVIACHSHQKATGVRESLNMAGVM